MHEAFRSSTASATKVMLSGKLPPWVILMHRMNSPHIYILDIRSSHSSQLTAIEMSSVTLLASSVRQSISNEVATLATENTKLKERVLKVRDQTPISLSILNIKA